MPPALPIKQYRNIRGTAKNTDSILFQCNFTTSNRGRVAVAETNLLCPKPRTNNVYKVSYYIDLSAGAHVLTS